MEKDVISGFSSPFTEHWLVVGLSEGVQWEEAGMTEPGFTSMGLGVIPLQRGVCPQVAHPRVV